MVKRKGLTITNREDTYNKVVSFIANEIMVINNEVNVHTTFEKVGVTKENKVSLIEKIAEHFAISGIGHEHPEKILDFIEYIHHLRHK